MKEQTIGGFPFIPYTPPTYASEEVKRRARQFYEFMNARRTVRSFSELPIPIEVVEDLIRTASTAPSGAHKQPWTFCIVSDPTIKRHIREAAEKEEFESYHNRMSEEWLDAIKPLQTDWKKPFLESSPHLIVVFKQVYSYNARKEKLTHYYVNESVGLACGFLLAAIHHAGLVALTHTPSPMNFLGKILDRPENERPFLLIPIGYPAEDTLVPDIRRKGIEEVAVRY